MRELLERRREMARAEATMLRQCARDHAGYYSEAHRLAAEWDEEAVRLTVLLRELEKEEKR